MTSRALALLSLFLLAACASLPPASRDLFTHGVASGDMRPDSTVLWTRTREPARLTPELSRTPGFETVVALPAVQTRAADDFSVRPVARGLQPGARYYYRFRAGDATSPVGTFRTPYAKNDHAAVRMAFTGDADWKWKPYPLAASLAQENLDFFFFLGDVIYETLDLQGNRVARNLDEYRFKYRENREPRANSPSGMAPLRDLYAAFGQYSVFDNHEIGNDDEPYTTGGAVSGAGFVNATPGFDARIQAYTEYQPVRDETVKGTGDARMDGTRRFFEAIPWSADVELIVLDDRSYRDARVADLESPEAMSCKRRMLGEPQRAWFEQALLAAQARGAVWKVVVISSPIQQFGTKSQVGLDLDSFKGWAGNFRCERAQVLKFIDDHAIDNVVFLTTDYHFTSINNLIYDSEPGNPKSPQKRARNAFEIITGPIGAISGSPLRARLAMRNPGTRQEDATIVAAMNDAMRKGGLDPIGLEADFPGLDAASVRVPGRPPGVVDPLAFVSYAAYSYVILTFDQSSVHVQLKAMPYVADPGVLDTEAAEAEYEARRPVEASSFVVRALTSAR